ncbi:FAS-associated death domain protein isoform X2 [Cricetulus griseus]|uniref:FAS-associated death domain protein isoform X2 n=1 Tax=Cricetulus griseus TaxID=10029 RepID=A0A9J7FNY7_CRIGR|nr:FAS-associated death domain protein isoform X2 [Cricetulus griseus]XP_027264605.1 FAS-associated death domain protein isoform X2 [Cricetulus griseus]
MDPFLVLLHSVSGNLSSSDLLELKFLCRERVSKRKLERVQSGLDLFSVLLEQNDLERTRTGLLRELLASLRRHDLLQRLDDFEAGTAASAAPGEADLRVAFDIVCDNVGRDWKRLARQLKVSEAKIDGIEERYPRSLSEQKHRDKPAVPVRSHCGLDTHHDASPRAFCAQRQEDLVGPGESLLTSLNQLLK